MMFLYLLVLLQVRGWGGATPCLIGTARKQGKTFDVKRDVVVNVAQ